MSYNNCSSGILKEFKLFNKNLNKYSQETVQTFYDDAKNQVINLVKIMKKNFLTGGAGYVGSRVVPYLINLGYEVTVYDIMYFTDKFLQNDQNLKIIQGDIRDTQKLKKVVRVMIILHLACISNDASFILDENLSKSVNFDCFEPMVLAAKENKIKRFIYASTSSVYGVSEKKMLPRIIH